MTVIEVEHLHKRYGADTRRATTCRSRSARARSSASSARTAPARPPPSNASRAARRRRRRGPGPRPRPAARPRPRCASVLGVQLQDSGLPDKLPSREALDLFASFYPDPRRHRPADRPARAGASATPATRSCPAARSSGWPIALAMVGNPRVVVLDELTTGLDPHARRVTWELVEQIRDRGVTVVLVTHFMEEAERLCDRVALIDAGRVVAVDTPAGLAGRRRAGAADALPAVRAAGRGSCSRPCPRSRTCAGTARRSRSPAPATWCTPSPRCSPAARSSPPTCGSTRPPWTTPSSP